MAKKSATKKKLTPKMAAQQAIKTAVKTRSGMEEGKLYGLSHQNLLDRVEALEKHIANTTNFSGELIQGEPLKAVPREVFTTPEGYTIYEVMDFVREKLITPYEAKQLLRIPSFDGPQPPTEDAASPVYHGYEIKQLVVYQVEGFDDAYASIEEAQKAIDTQLQGQPEHHEAPHFDQV